MAISLLCVVGGTAVAAADGDDDDLDGEPAGAVAAVQQTPLAVPEPVTTVSVPSADGVVTAPETTGPTTAPAAPNDPATDVPATSEPASDDAPSVPAVTAIEPVAVDPAAPDDPGSPPAAAEVTAMDAAAAVPQISIGDLNVDEGDIGNAPSAVPLTWGGVPLPTTVIVNLTRGHGTTNALDFASAEPQFVIVLQAGETSRNVTDADWVKGDRSTEPNETFTVTITAVRNATIGRGTATGTIIDDDTALVSVQDISVPEGDDGTSTTDVEVVMSEALAVDVSMRVATEDGTADGSDYESTVSDLTIRAGSTSVLFPVATSGDTTDEPDETFFVTILSVDAATVDRGTGVVTIDDDDGPTVSVSGSSVVEGDDRYSTNAARVEVTLSAPTFEPVTVDLSTSVGSAAEPGEDYDSMTARLTIPAGETSAWTSVAVRGDDLDEPDETVIVFIGSIDGPASIAGDIGEVTILDNELPTLTVDDDAAFEQAGAATNLGFVVSLSNPKSFAVSFDATTIEGSATAGSDYEPTSTSATIPAGSRSVTVGVPIIDDAVSEPDETITFSVSDVVGALGSAPPAATGTIIDDETLAAAPAIRGRASFTPSTTTPGTTVYQTGTFTAINVDGATTYEIAIDLTGFNGDADYEYFIVRGNFRGCGIDNAHYDSTCTWTPAPGDTATISVSVRVRAGATPADWTGRTYVRGGDTLATATLTIQTEPTPTASTTTTSTPATTSTTAPPSTTASPRTTAPVSTTTATPEGSTTVAGDEETTSTTAASGGPTTAAPDTGATAMVRRPLAVAAARNGPSALPATGRDDDRVITIGVVLLAGGVAALLVARRRSADSSPCQSSDRDARPTR